MRTYKGTESALLEPPYQHPHWRLVFVRVDGGPGQSRRRRATWRVDSSLWYFSEPIKPTLQHKLPSRNNITLAPPDSGSVSEPPKLHARSVRKVVLPRISTNGRTCSGVVSSCLERNHWIQRTYRVTKGNHSSKTNGE